MLAAGPVSSETVLTGSDVRRRQAFCTGEGGAAEAMLARAVAANPAHPSALCNYGQLLLNKAFSFRTMMARDAGGGSTGGGGRSVAGGGEVERRPCRWVIVPREEDGEAATAGQGEVAARDTAAAAEGAVDESQERGDGEVDEAAAAEWARRGIEALERVLCLEPRHTPSLCALSQALRATASHDPALTARAEQLVQLAYQRAPHWDPLLRATACCNLAVSLVGGVISEGWGKEEGRGKDGGEEKREEAMELLQEALRVFPSHVPSLACAAKFYVAQGEYARAEQALHKACLVSPDLMDLQEQLEQARRHVPASNMQKNAGTRAQASMGRKRARSMQALS